MVYWDGSCNSCPPCLWRKTMNMHDEHQEKRIKAMDTILDRIIESAHKAEDAEQFARAYALLYGSLV